MARSKVKSRSHHDVAHLHPVTNVPTKYQLPTPYGFRDTGRTNFFPPPACPDTMGENNTPTALKGCGVIKIYQPSSDHSKNKALVHISVKALTDSRRAISLEGGWSILKMPRPLLRVASFSFSACMLALMASMFASASAVEILLENGPLEWNSSSRFATDFLNSSDSAKSPVLNFSCKSEKCDADKSKHNSQTASRNT